MVAYKAFDKGLRCRGYQFKMGLNVTEKAKAVNYGFHCAENPLDCLTYYGNMNTSDYYLVDAGGDLNEDGTDTKIACTELTIQKKLTKKEFVLHALAYMVDKPKRPLNHLVKKEKGRVTEHGFVIVRGKDPIAQGRKGDALAYARDNEEGKIVEVSMVTVDGTDIRAGVWYGIDLTERQVAEP